MYIAEIHCHTIGTECSVLKRGEFIICSTGMRLDFLKIPNGAIGMKSLPF